MRANLPSEQRLCLFPEKPLPVVEVAEQTEQAVAEAVAQINAAGTGTLYFPAGFYPVTGKLGGAIRFEGVDRVCVHGQGELSQIFLQGTNTAQPRVMEFADSQNMEVYDLAFDGNRQVIAPLASNELSHSIQLRGVDRFYIHDIISREQHGDGINISSVSNGIIERMDIDDNNRNGITLGFHGAGPSDARNILIINNRLGAGIDTQQIDIEDNNASDIYILQNTLEEMLPEDNVLNDQYGIGITSIPGNTVVERILIRDNTIDNPIVLSNAKEVEISRNTQIEHLSIWNGSDLITICENMFEGQIPSTTNFRNPDHAAIRVYADGPGIDLSDNIIIDSNTFRGETGQWAINVEDTQTLARITNNSFDLDNGIAETRINADNVNTTYQFDSNTGANQPVVSADAGLNVSRIDQEAYRCMPDPRSVAELLPLQLSAC